MVSVTCIFDQDGWIARATEPRQEKLDQLKLLPAMLVADAAATNSSPKLSSFENTAVTPMALRASTADDKLEQIYQVRQWQGWGNLWNITSQLEVVGQI
jgi:hypothetical protein